MESKIRLFSAWNVHSLTTSLPQAYHIAVKRGRKVTLPVFPKVELHHITDTMFDIGIEEQIVSGYRILIYSSFGSNFEPQSLRD